MTEQHPAQDRPDFQPPGGDPAGQPVPPVQPGGQHYPPPVPQVPGGQPPMQPYQPPPPRPTTGRGSIWLGVGITIATLLASWGLAVMVRYDSPLAPVTNLLAAGLPFALVIGGIAMAAIPRTTRTGAGILIGIGAGILIAGGLCFALLLGLDSLGG